MQKAKITKEAVIKASSIFGGIEIKVPSDANIKVKSRPIFGGVSNKILNKVENEKTIVHNNDSVVYTKKKEVIIYV